MGALVDWQFDEKARDRDFVRVGELDIQLADLRSQRRAIPCDKKERPELRDAWEKALAERGKLLAAAHQLRVDLRHATIDALLKHPRRGTPPGAYVPVEIDDSIIWSMEVLDLQDRKIGDAKGNLCFGSVAVLAPEIKERLRYSKAKVIKFIDHFMEENRHLGRRRKQDCLAAARQDPEFRDLNPPLPLRAISNFWKERSIKLGLGWHGPGHPIKRFTLNPL
jgi:hypothetical protein